MMKRISLLDILLLLAILLAAAGWAYLLMNPPQKPDTQSKPAVFQLKLSPMTNLEPIRTFAAVTDRPLFWKDRKQAEPEDDVVQDDPKEEVKAEHLKDYRLIGIVKYQDVQIAIIREQKAKRKVQRLALNEKLDGWKLTAVEKDYADFKRGAESYRMEVLVEKNKPVAPKPLIRNLKRQRKRK